MDRINYLKNMIATFPARIVAAETKGNAAAAKTWRFALEAAERELATRLKIAGA